MEYSFNLPGLSKTKFTLKRRLLGWAYEVWVNGNLITGAGLINVSFKVPIEDNEKIMLIKMTRTPFGPPRIFIDEIEVFPFEPLIFSDYLMAAIPAILLIIAELTKHSGKSIRYDFFYFLIPIVFFIGMRILHTRYSKNIRYGLIIILSFLTFGIVRLINQL